MTEETIGKIIESLSVNEIKILPHLGEGIEKICKKTGLEKVAVIRSLEYLKKKGVLNLSHKAKKKIELGVNGARYKNKELPERKLLNILRNKKVVPLIEAKKSCSLTDEELKVSIGVLKSKGLIEIKNGNMVLSVNTEKISQKMPEEIFLESLPRSYDSLSKNEIETLNVLTKRKEIVEIGEERETKVALSELGKKLSTMKINDNLVEQITPKILEKDSNWRGKKFRRYDITVGVPKIHGGKRHFVLQASDYAKEVWKEMGFREMTGNMIQSSFWNFDALFTAQDHPVREMQDTFFIDKKNSKIDADNRIIKMVKESHEGTLLTEKNFGKSKGWRYSWNDEEAKKLVLRTHTTCLSVQTLAKLKVEGLPLPAKFFALGKTFRNETVDWKHGFEFNQTEGIVVDKNANFRHLLGYLKQFFKKMGFEKIRFRPAYFPYTEPSVEIDVYHEERKEWLELGGAGIFRPEVVVPLLGENIPVLAWGPGFDRILMDYYKIKDIRELYKNDIKQLRKIKFWVKS